MSFEPTQVRVAGMLNPLRSQFRMGRAGLEPATLGLKVLHIDAKTNLKKRRFKPLYKPFRNSLGAVLDRAFVAERPRYVLVSDPSA
jgi:hypothetical protein